LKCAVIRFAGLLVLGSLAIAPRALADETRPPLRRFILATLGGSVGVTGYEPRHRELRWGAEASANVTTRNPMIWVGGTLGIAQPGRVTLEVQTMVWLDAFAVGIGAGPLYAYDGDRWGGQATAWVNLVGISGGHAPIASPVFPFLRFVQVGASSPEWQAGLLLKLPCWFGD
jgi:hypothetical protein